MPASTTFALATLASCTMAKVLARFAQWPTAQGVVAAQGNDHHLG